MCAFLSERNHGQRNDRSRSLPSGLLHASSVNGRLFDLEISVSQSRAQRMLDLSKLAYLLPRLWWDQSFAGFGERSDSSRALVPSTGADRRILGMQLLDFPNNLAYSERPRPGAAV